VKRIVTGAGAADGQDGGDGEWRGQECHDLADLAPQHPQFIEDVPEQLGLMVTLMLH
jgi:hypothetical protein